MANEFLTVWKNENEPEYALNDDNLGFISPHLIYTGKQFIYPVDNQRNKLRILGNTAVKLIIGGKHKLFKISNDLEFIPLDNLDIGSILDPGTDYHLYAVANGDGASIVLSKNATFPSGASSENSRRIGGFHTECADIGALQLEGHPLLGFMARDILPNSVHDLLHRPAKIGAQGMVYDPQTNIWVDIYVQSGTLNNTKSVYQGTVTKSRSWDGHSEDLAAVGKRMLKDQEFTSAAWGTIPYKAVMGAVDPITTGGKVNTDGRRIVSDIGCEDMAGCYYFWLDEGGCYTGTYAYAHAVGAKGGNQGQQYLPDFKMVAGGHWGNAAYSGARSRYAYNSRASVGAYYSSRGCSDALGVV